MMKARIMMLAVLILLGFAGPMKAQNSTVSGEVVDSQTGETVPGVNVLVKGTSIGTATNAEGVYSLTVPSLSDTLVFSFIGYQTNEVLINGRTQINVSLSPEAIAGEELVVIGYGTVQKSDLTGSVSSVNVDELNQGITTSVGQMLVGKSAGVSVVQSSGEPGGGLSINIRGAGSVNASNSPLYVIDGVPISNDREIIGTGTGVIASPNSPRSPLSSLNSEDIESIEILKDASATAIYGSRGANGVVLITTKEGQTGEFQVDYHGYASIQNLSNKLDLLEPQEYKDVLNEIIDAGGADDELRVREIVNNGTKWQNEISNSNAFAQSQQLSFSGGTENTTYYLSFDYMNQEGLIKSSEFNRYSGRINVNSQVSENFNINLKLTTSYVKDVFVPQGTGFNETAGVMYTAQFFDPTLPVRDSESTFTTSQLMSIDNPMALINGVDSESNTNRTFGSVTAEYAFTENLSAKVNFGSNFTSEARTSYISRIAEQGRQRGGVGSLQEARNSDYLVEGTLHYSNNFSEIHNINGIVGVTYQRFIMQTSAESAEGFPSDAVGADKRCRHLLTEARLSPQAAII